MANAGLHPILNFDPLIDEAARRAFNDQADAYYSEANDDPVHNLALRTNLLKMIDELGFCDVLEDPSDRDSWSNAAAIIRAQARAAAPLDMVTLLLDNNRDAALAWEPARYEALPATQTAAGAQALDNDPTSAMRGLGRLLQLSAAMDSALDISLQYVKDRKQFGRPLAAFQAVQHSLAIAAEEVAAATAITDLCLATLVDEGSDSQRLPNLLMAAAVVNNRAVSVVFDAVHQVHGAIGFTREYVLHRHTLNMLTWRDQIAALLGSDIHCAEQLAFGITAHAGVWPTVIALMTPAAR